MSRNTLIGFVLIGLILLFWPTYLDMVFPEKTPENPQEKTAPKEVLVAPKATPSPAVIK